MLRVALGGVFAVLVLLPAASFGGDNSDEGGEPSPLELFEQRIMPIFRSPQPASCVQCHLAAVDLKDYILPSHEQTFASLREQGLIDLAEPEKSKILTLIQMGEKDLDKGARLIHDETRKAEYEAFAAWIKACCNDPVLCELPRLSATELARPKRPDRVIRHARKSRVVDSFVRNIWSQRMRCFPCHTPHELDESNPKHRLAIRRYKEFMAKHGKELGARMHIFRETPEATMEYLIRKSRKPPEGELPLVNLASPQKSLLVLKPTSKVPQKNEQGEFARPSYAEPVSHMGGLKMHVDDQSYKSFIAWMQDYARVVGDQYTSVEELPRDNWHASQHVIIMRDLPEAWPDRARVQLFVHAWSDQNQSWESEPMAFTQGSLTPRRTVAGALFLLGPIGPIGPISPIGTGGSDNPRELGVGTARLAPGKYLLKAYVDWNSRLADDPTVLLGEEDFFGQAEIQARWRNGFPEAEKISGTLFR